MSRSRRRTPSWLGQLRSDGESVLEEIATPFTPKRMELGRPTTLDPRAASSTKDELVAEAKSAGIEDAASMIKDALASALAEQIA